MAPRWHAGEPANEPEPEPKKASSGGDCAGASVLLGGLLLVLIGLGLAYLITR